MKDVKIIVCMEVTVHNTEEEDVGEQHQREENH